jgi:predicted ribosome quality control (RQC) complex YloA/Tae2 family protein
MENFTLHALVTELASLLIGQRLGKMYQLGVTDLALDFRLRDGRWLLLSTDPKRLALYLTARSVRQLETEARADTAFVALGKKYLSGARVVAVESLDYDRVVRLSLRVEEENQPELDRALAIHLTGRSANVFVLEQERVLAALRERPASETEATYHEPAPPVDKLDPFYCSAETFAALIAANEGDMIAAAQTNLIGFGLQYATELAARAARQAPATALAELLDESFAQAPAPAVYSSAPLEELQQDIGSAEFTLTFAPIAMEHLRTLHRTPFASVNQAADACHTLLDERRRFLAAKQQAESTLKTRLKKLQALEKNLLREREGFANSAGHQRCGELLLANLHQAEKVGADFRVVDFYDPEQKTMAIPAAKQATAQEAAEHYFKLARKARTGLQAINQRLPEIAAQISNLQSQITQLSTLTQAAQLNALLAAMGLSPRRAEQPPTTATPPKKAKAEKLTGVRRYRSSDGYEILVGRTSRDNDQLTLRVAKSYDLWFHAADYGGSHVVLRNPKRAAVPQRALLEAAQLAAKFSQANNDSGAKVAVNYCEKKFVTKPKGFAPGQVRLSSYKTVLVEPAEAGERIY